MSRAARDVVVVVLTVVGGGMVAAADLSRSYIPLFISWVAFAAIPWALSRMEKPEHGDTTPS